MANELGESIFTLNQTEVMTYVFALLSVDVKDKLFRDECPVDSIYEGDRMLTLTRTSAWTAVLANRLPRDGNLLSKN